MGTRKRKERPLFHPDTVKTQLHQALLRDLDDINKHESMSPAAWQFLYTAQSQGFLKKWSLAPDDVVQELEDQAFNTFIGVNERMGKVNIPALVEGSFYGLTSRSTDAERILYRARNLCNLVLGDIGIDEWFSACKHSAGSSLGVPFRDTSIERKFTFPITATKSCAPLFSQYLAWDNVTHVAVKDFNRNTPIGGMYEWREGSRATTVDKAIDKRRMIAIEPTANMFLQQGLMTVMYNRLKDYGLDVEVLPREHTLQAFKGSLTGRVATIDFSSASDCVHTELLRFLLPARWFRLLDTVRCHTMEINSKFLTLNMFSTMGNATTFPLETLVFWSLGAATCSLDQVSPNALVVPERVRSQVSVFGDDCILPTEYASSFMEIAAKVGFIVNEDKSFTDPMGCFRESCGGDYHSGHNVRPYYLRAPSSNRLSALAPWIFIQANSYLTFLKNLVGKEKYCYYQEYMKQLQAVLKEHNLQWTVVPDYYPDDAGLKAYGDWQRLNAVYRFDARCVSRSHHGTYTFTFYRFMYKAEVSNHSGIRYADWLKTRTTDSSSAPRPFLRKQEESHRRRQNGSYVVARGISAHWAI